MIRHIKNHFIPHEDNEHIPHSLREHTVLIMLLIAMSLYLMPNVWRMVTTQTRAYAAILPLVIIDITNEERIRHGLKTLKIDDKLMQSAKGKSEHMAANQYFAHDAPDGTYPWKFFVDANYNFRFGGENLAIYFSDSGDVVKGWMNSPTHRENILDSRFEDIGVAFTAGNYKNYNTEYIVQHFGSTASNVLNIEGTQSKLNIPSETITVGGKTMEYKRITEPVTMTQAELDAIPDYDLSKISKSALASNIPDETLNKSMKVEKTSEIVPHQTVQDKYELVTSIREVKGLSPEIVKNEVDTEIQEVSKSQEVAPTKYSTLSDKLFIFPENISKIALTVLMVYSIICLLFLFVTEIRHHHLKHMGYGVMLVLVMAATHLSL